MLVSNQYLEYPGKKITTKENLEEKLVGNQYLIVLRILVLLRYQLLKQLLQNLRSTAYIKLINFQDKS